MNECCICYSPVDENPQICGHYTHMSCLEKHFKPECPVCRKVLNIKVSGSRPENNIPISFSDEDENENQSDTDRDESLDNNGVVSNIYECRHQLSDSWKNDGYLYKEEHPDYDEENPDDLEDDLEDADYENNTWELY